MARYLACLIYRLMTKGQAWIDGGEAAFENKRTERELRSLQGKAKEMSRSLASRSIGSTGNRRKPLVSAEGGSLYRVARAV